jgi:L-ribulokinase
MREKRMATSPHLAGRHAFAGSSQTTALGAAISAAVAAGRYATFEAAQAKMTSLQAKRFNPKPAARAVYDELYGMYRELHDTFGAVPGARADLGAVMKKLLSLRERVSRSGR